MISSTSCKPKILVADDHRLMLDSLSTLFGNEYEVHAVDNLTLLEQSVDWLSPDLIILDVRMPDGNSFDVARRLLQTHPAIRLMFLTMHSEASFVKKAADLGASAYIPKRAPAQEVLFAVHTVLNGGKYLKLPDHQTESHADDTPELTPRQIEVLRLISQGCSAKEIANSLNISVRTAEFHRAAIMERLKMHSTALMTRYAVEHGIA